MFRLHPVNGWDGALADSSDGIVVALERPPWLAGLDPEWWHSARTLPFAALLDWLNQQAEGRGLRSGDRMPLSFVPQSGLPKAMAYESWIAQTGQVPTRDLLHDRLNALAWLSYPKTKARLNHVQALEIALHGAQGPRGGVRDAATLWDENLLVLACDGQTEPLQSLLQAADWTSLFCRHRARWNQEWQPMIFGHALLEKLERPYKALTAHCLVVSADQSEIDRRLSEMVDVTMRPSAFLPLPVMGLPGWYSGDQSPDFYQDRSVFRSPRARDSRHF